MKWTLYIYLFLIFASFSLGCSNSSNKPSDAVLEIVTADSLSDFEWSWHVGMRVDSGLLATIGIDGFFTVSEISDSLFNLMNGNSYHDYSPVTRQDLRYLQVLYIRADGLSYTGELVCNAVIADDLIEIFRNLYLMRYPIERMTIIDHYNGDDEASMTANNTSCYNCRRMTNGRRLSLHAYGLAVDVNPLYNPYVKTDGGRIVDLQPKAGAKYMHRPDTVYVIKRGDECCRQFAQHGFSWGGDWKRSVKDYQHFQPTKTMQSKIMSKVD